MNDDTRHLLAQLHDESSTARTRSSCNAVPRPESLHALGDDFAQ
jgi:hypothetical protein